MIQFPYAEKAARLDVNLAAISRMNYLIVGTT